MKTVIGFIFNECEFEDCGIAICKKLPDKYNIEVD